MFASRNVCTLLLAASVLLAASTPVRADPNTPLRTAAAELAKSIKTVLDEKKQSTVTVGDFDGPPALNSRFGPGIQAALADELTKLGITFGQKADLSLAGEYAVGEEVISGESQLVITLSARLSGAKGEELAKIVPARITDNKTIARFTGATVTLKPLADKATRNEAIRKALKAPGVFVDGNKLAAAPAANMTVELFARQRAGVEAEVRKPKVADGRAVVTIEEGETFEVRLYNANAYEGAVTVSVDGVDAFQFSKERDEKTKYPRLTHFLVPPQKSLTVAGWHLTSDPAAKEGVRPFRTEPDARPGWFNLPRVKTGVITITYACAAATKEQLREYDGVRGVIDVDAGYMPGAKAGDKEETRFIGVVREVVSIRYPR